MRVHRALIAIAAIAPAAHAARVDVLVPAYFYPTLGTEWAMLAASAPAARLTIIVNPASGPGTSVDPNYTQAVNTARAAGARVIGYVDTDYARRATALVLADVATYMGFYAVDGIFFDQMDNAPASLGYYQSLTAGVHALIPAGLVVANAGTTVPQAFAAAIAADVIVTYENDAASPTEPYATAVPPAWVYAFPPSRFATIVYNIPTAAAMRADLALAVHRNAAFVFFTNDVLINPYDTLPQYWNALVAAAAALCVADVDDGTGLGAPDGGVTIDDLLFFLHAFDAGDLRADVDDGTSRGRPDGGITIDDLLYFLARFDAGC